MGLSGGRYKVHRESNSVLDWRRTWVIRNTNGQDNRRASYRDTEDGTRSPSCGSREPNNGKAEVIYVHGIR